MFFNWSCTNTCFSFTVVPTNTGQLISIVIGAVVGAIVGAVVIVVIVLFGEFPLACTSNKFNHYYTLLQLSPL